MRSDVVVPRETARAGILFGCIAGLPRSHRPMGAQSPKSGDCTAQLRFCAGPDTAVYIIIENQALDGVIIVLDHIFQCGI